MITHKGVLDSPGRADVLTAPMLLVVGFAPVDLGTYLAVVECLGLAASTGAAFAETWS